MRGLLIIAGMHEVNCQRLMCLLLMGTHAVWSISYQGSPVSVGKFAVSSSSSQVERVELKGKFDSEERPREVESRSQSTSRSGGGGRVHEADVTLSAFGSLSV
ncbi:hypothetical protein GCM10009828_062870 [Actinoplanes couchii]|uniref:Secreted protein n=1 Tax=Actinoplanes couchii TaxID=403638 RepID=A0ABQ3X3V3_9ACTN|nr:hypothetical protein Aco03nite_014920 [Actinoplanes couchii]